MIKNNKLLKKVISIFLICGLVLSVSSCSFALDKPEDEVDRFLGALKTKQTDVLMKYVESKEINSLLNGVGDKKALDSIYDNLLKNFSYEILSSSKDGDKATVTVKISNVSFKKAVKNYNKKASEYMINSMYSKGVSKDKLNKKCLSLFAAEIKAAGNSKKIVDKEIVVDLVRNDEYGYDINMTDEFLGAVFGGLDMSVF